MIRLARNFFWVAVGAAAALEADKLLARTRSRLSPSVMTGNMLDRLNQRLESKSRSKTPYV
jgi:hypothetical protein